MRIFIVNPSYGTGFVKAARWFAKSRGRVQRHPDYLARATAVLEEAGILSITGVERRVLLRVDDVPRALEALAGVRDRVRIVEDRILHLLPPPGDDVLAFLESALVGVDPEATLAATHQESRSHP